MGRFADRIIENNNLFWEDVREYFLKDFFNTAYGGKKRELIKSWLRNSDSKTMLLRQIDTEYRPDFVSDPLLIRVWPDRFEIIVADISEGINADVEMNATHEAIVMATVDLTSFLIAVIEKKIRLPKLWRNIRDHYYAARLFFF